MTPVWKFYENLKIKSGETFVTIKGITEFNDSTTSTVTKHNHYDLKGRNTADIFVLNETYSITADVLPDGEDAGNAKLVSLANKMGDDAKAEMQLKNPYTGDSIAFTACFELHFGSADNVGTVTGTMHIDGEPTAVVG